ncbi:hypothetical protein ASE66_25020 [Bosea sp. Root483D1]|nr:hypothetical protein ASE66_25020 [Bosea sp. Root483D1]
MSGKAVENLVRAAPEPRRVDICPFAAASGYSACSAALGERLLLALDAESRSDDRVLRARPLEIRRPARAMRSRWHRGNDSRPLSQRS